SNDIFSPTVQIDKFGLGQLILPTGNNYTGPTAIQAGWVTIENAQSLGQQIAGVGDTVQPTTTVLTGAALHVLPLTGNLNLTNNFVLAGRGVTNTGYSLIDGQGALMNLSGVNTVSG